MNVYTTRLELLQNEFDKWSYGERLDIAGAINEDILPQSILNSSQPVIHQQDQHDAASADDINTATLVPEILHYGMFLSLKVYVRLDEFGNISKCSSITK